MKLQWQYYVAYSYCKTTKKGGLFSKAEREWIIVIDGKEMGLAEGLTFMGDNYWELVTVQKPIDYHGGQAPDWDYVPAHFIFKTSKW